MHEFLYDYVKPKYREKGNVYYMDTDIFIVQKKSRGHLLRHCERC